MSRYSERRRVLGPVDLALAYTLHHPADTAPIIGPRTMYQLVGSVRATEIKLDDSQLRALLAA